MWPARENRLSHGTVEAGVAKDLGAIWASLARAPLCADHHRSGHASMLTLAFAPQRSRVVSVDGASSSDSDSICRRPIFLFGVSGSISSVEGMWCRFLDVT